MLQPNPIKKIAKKAVKKNVPKKVSIDRTKQNPADEYPNLKDKTGFPIMGGGEGRRAPFKKGGVIKKAKNGKSFPDLNKDGKVTKKDVLIGKGVLPKTAKKGTTVKKAKVGASMKKCRYGCK